MAVERLDRRMRAAYPTLSWTRVREAIGSGQVRIDGALARDPAHLVDEGARITFDPSAPRLAHARLDLPALYEDESILVIDKPAGLLTIASSAHARHHEDTVLRRVSEYATRLHGRRAYAGVLHRLDRETSGALALALSREAHVRGRTIFSEHGFDRRYLALVHGMPEPHEGTIDAAVSNRYVSGRRHLVARDSEGRPAVTHYRVCEAFDGVTLVELRLETGRQHQIRLHMERLGHPLVGERVYAGSSESNRSRGSGRGAPQNVRLKVARQMLHAWRLAFSHPLTGELIRVEAPLPDDFERTLRGLRR
jgi:23S rRNA pseudouridine1911/1915/1917 synthase